MFVHVGYGVFRLEKLDNRYLGFRMVKIIEPPQIIPPNPKFKGKITVDVPVEGELIRRRGEIFRLDMDAENARVLRDLPAIDGESRSFNKMPRLKLFFRIDG